MLCRFSGICASMQACTGPTLNGSSALQRFECNNAIEYAIEYCLPRTDMSHNHLQNPYKSTFNRISNIAL